MIELTTTLQPITPPHGSNTRGRMILKLIQKPGKTAYVTIARFAYAQIGAPKFVMLLLSKTHIALAPTDAKDKRARRVDSSLNVRIPDAAQMLHMKEGDQFVIDVQLVDGQLVGELPSKLFFRRTQGERQELNGKVPA